MGETTKKRDAQSEQIIEENLGEERIDLSLNIKWISSVSG